MYFILSQRLQYFLTYSRSRFRLFECFRTFRAHALENSNYRYGKAAAKSNSSYLSGQCLLEHLSACVYTTFSLSLIAPFAGNLYLHVSIFTQHSARRPQ